MDALWALGTILGIIGVVLAGGFILAVLVNIISGAFSGSERVGKKQTDVLDYNEYKLLNNEITNENLKINQIDETKAEKEAEEIRLDTEPKDDFKLEDVTDDGDLDEIEKRLQAQSQEHAVEDVQTQTEAVEDDEDIDSLLDDISNDVIEDAKDEINTKDEETMKTDSTLDNYSIDEILENMNSETADADANEERTEEEVPVEITEEETEPTEVVEEENEELGEEAEDAAAVETEEELVEETDTRAGEIEELKRQVEELNRQLEIARASTVQTEVVIDMTEEECLNRIATVEERLKNLKKDYKVNLKEYKPLKRVRENLEKYQTKLRRREAVAAKKKVALYGVNNYVDIDKDKAEKLANELELLDGLRLSVQHCEEVIESSKDRYPILENTNNILEEQIANTEADLAELQLKLEKIREKQGK